PVGVDRDVDAPRHHPDDGAVEALVADQHVRAAAEQQPVVSRAPDLERRLHELLARRGLHEFARGAPDPEGRELRERTPRVRHHGRHGSRRARTCALPSTVSPLKVTVRSMRAASSSMRPTLAVTVTTAPSAASTTTGRVNRTW